MTESSNYISINYVQNINYLLLETDTFSLVMVDWERSCSTTIWACWSFSSFTCADILKTNLPKYNVYTGIVDLQKGTYCIYVIIPVINDIFFSSSSKLFINFEISGYTKHTTQRTYIRKHQNSRTTFRCSAPLYCDVCYVYYTETKAFSLL